MTLSEIETILEELIVRHQGIDETLLSTLLTASGWEDKNIKEAIMLFRQKPSKGFLPQNKIETVPQKISSELPLAPLEEMTFYHPDGEEEVLHPTEETIPFVRDTLSNKDIKNGAVEELQIKTTSELLPNNKEEVGIVEEKSIPDIPEANQSIKETDFDDQNNLIDLNKTEIYPQQNTIQLASLPQAVIPEEEESLIVPLEEKKSPQKQNHIPEDLPLVPFESSPHVWSFAKYKNVFHSGETISEEEVASIEQTRVAIETPEIKNNQELPPIKNKPIDTKDKDDVEEIIVEKTPMTREDESLVFLAGIMLLAIILILGYMYSNGRL